MRDHSIKQHMQFQIEVRDRVGYPVKFSFPMGPGWIRCGPNIPRTVMIEPSIHRMPRPQEVSRMTTEELRAAFLVPQIYQPGRLCGCFTDLDRLVVAGAMPGATPAGGTGAAPAGSSA